MSEKKIKMPKNVREYLKCSLQKIRILLGSCKILISKKIIIKKPLSQNMLWGNGLWETWIGKNSGKFKKMKNV